VTSAGRSIFYFGFWVLACGLALFSVPAFCLGLMDIVLPTYVPVRLFGMVLVYLSIYYFVAGRRPEFWPLYRATVYTRASALLVVLALVALGESPPMVVGFVLVDALGAAWTAAALRKDRREGRIPGSKAAPSAAS
jgi:uncharacterized membrane-anchored protein